MLKILTWPKIAFLISSIKCFRTFKTTFHLQISKFTIVWLLADFLLDDNSGLTFDLTILKSTSAFHLLYLCVQFLCSSNQVIWITTFYQLVIYIHCSSVTKDFVQLITGNIMEMEQCDRAMISKLLSHSLQLYYIIQCHGASQTTAFFNSN